MITYLFQTIYLKVHLYPNDLRCHFFHILNFHVIWRLYLDYSVLVYLSVSLLMFHIALIIKALQNILISDKNQSPHTVFLSQCFSTCLCMLFFLFEFQYQIVYLQKIACCYCYYIQFIINFGRTGFFFLNNNYNPIKNKGCLSICSNLNQCHSRVFKNFSFCRFVYFLLNLLVSTAF